MKKLKATLITILVFILIFPALNGQKKIILTTDEKSNWTITKNSQPYPFAKLPESTPWLIDLNSGELDNSWTKDVKIADLAGSQISIVDEIGNNARPIWIAKSLCNYSDNSVQPQTYNFRNTFVIEDCAEISKAQLRYSADNSCRIYINGKQIVSDNGLYQYEGYNLTCDNSCGFSINEYSVNYPASDFNCRGFNNVEVATISHLLVPGTNVIAVENLNTGGCAVNYGWICINMEIEYFDGSITADVSEIVNKTCDKSGSFKVTAHGGSGIYQYEISGQYQNDHGSFDNLLPGNYKVKVTDQNNCVVYVDVEVKDQGIIPELFISELDNVIDCGDNNSSITTYGMGGPGIKYIFDNGQPSDIGFFNDIASGLHTLYIINEYGCSSDTFHFEVHSAPTYFLKLVYDEMCPGDSLNILKKTYSSAGLYFDTIIAPGQMCDTLIRIEIAQKTISESYLEFDICYGDSIVIKNKSYHTSGQFYQTLDTPYGCDSLLNINISIREEKKSATFYEICAGDTIVIGDNKYFAPGDYESILQSTEGCDSILELRIQLKDINLCETERCGRYFIPNVFTPNNDGKNDYFEVNVKDVTITFMAIYDRWGDVVFTSSQNNPQWDGMFASHQAGAGVYVYMIRGHCINNYPIFKYGDVTLVR